MSSIGKDNVLVRGCADGSGIRSKLRCINSQVFLYPIEEAPEHLSQLSDIATYCHEPLWTVDNRKDTEKDYVKWLNGKKTDENRRQFSQQSLGRFASSAIMMDMKDFYSGITHKVCRVAESIALRVNVVCQQFPSVSKKFLEKIRSIKGKVHDEKVFIFHLVKQKQ